MVHQQARALGASFGFSTVGIMGWGFGYYRSIQVSMTLQEGAITSCPIDIGLFRPSREMLDLESTPPVLEEFRLNPLHLHGC